MCFVGRKINFPYIPHDSSRISRIDRDLSIFLLFVFYEYFRQHSWVLVGEDDHNDKCSDVEYDSYGDQTGRCARSGDDVIENEAKEEEDVSANVLLGL